MEYLEITIITTTAASEIAAEILSEEGSSGISVLDKHDLFELEKEEAACDYIDESLLESLGDYARVSGYFGTKEKDEILRSLEARLEQLKAGDYGIELGPLEIITRTVDDGDWADVWKKHFKPITIKDITVVPEWLARGGRRAGGARKAQGLPHKEGKRVILNPGMAFGTGEHETTAMCIELLQAASLRGKTVVDLGCGSGILGITAAVLGADKVTMIDIDPLAAEAARLNVGLNEKENSAVKNIEVFEGNLFRRADIKADLIVANLASALLISAATEIAAHLYLGGALILSGIIDARAREVTDAYESVLGKGAVKQVMRKGEWVALYIYA